MEKDFSDLQTEGSAESLRRSLESQRELFHEQIDQFQKIVLAQCNLTGVNPLAQEMAAGALSIKIGKRPRDLLNPKAVKYMQYIFSIKDVVNKKECREISALFGVTATQAREYFASQRSRVRKIVSSSREKAISSNTCLELPEEIPTSTDSLVVPMDIVPLNTIVPNKSEEPPFCSTEDDVLSGIDDSDKQFVENIFSLMHKEETFSGQVKLMEWVLRIQNSAVLSWFLSKGGTVILATWLTQAAVEEQTSVLLVILNVLCHLPLNKALPIHMSAILQSVNRLRFYKSSDISNRARVLLAKWSKLLARSQALKKFNGGTQYIDAQREILLKQSLKDVVADESWQSNFDSAENILSCSDDFWKSEPTQVLRILPPPSDDSNKKNILGVSSSQIRERRKVQLVEQPGQKTSGRSPQAGRAGPSNQSRPMSTDDIQKAKMRAQLMQNKYKKASLSNENKKLKTEIQNRPSTLTGTVPPAPRVPVQPIDDKHKKHVPLPVIATNRLENSLDLNPKMDLKESIWERCRRVQIPWQTPPEVKLSDPWSVGAGENSKEVEVQKNRNRREKETMYLVAKEIPQNPKEPWDREMDYDDTLTPVIPAEQLPEGDIIETQIDSPTESENGVVTASQFHAGNATATEPDLELLAVLLKNPELVIALTSGQTANMSSAEKMKLLDMIKAGRNATTSLNGVVSKQVEHKVEVSLPSPTPPSNPGTSGWRPEVARNPFSQQLHRVAVNQSATTVAAKQVSSIHLSTPQVVSEAVPQYSAAQVTSVVHQKYAQFGGQLHHNDNSLTSSSSVQRTNLYTPNITNSSHIVSSPMNNSEERFRMALSPSPPLVRLPPQQRQHYQAGPAYTKEYVNSSSESWRARDYNNSSLISQSNNGYVLYDGPAQTGPPARRIPVGPRWEGNEYREREDYETWSPENSPSRNREGSAMMGRNFSEQRTSGYRGDHSRARNSSNSSGYSDYNNRYGSRKWHDDRRR